VRWQRALTFAEDEAEQDRMLSAAEILLSDPERYPGLSQMLAICQLHRLGKPHARAECPICRREDGVARACD
jgi:hypothetical protein